jgi:hypothetical protein
MPTGYTADVADGKVTDLEPFILQCARGMGALIMMRDEPSNAPIPERFEPSDYHTKKLTELRAERDRLRNLSPKDVEAEATAELAQYEADKARAKQENTERRNRYNGMIAQVVQWEGAPEGIKEFALEQLRRGRDFDCPTPFRYYRDPPLADGSEWRASKLEKLAKDIKYHAAEEGKEKARAEGRNAWLAQLRLSLSKVGEKAPA